MTVNVPATVGAMPKSFQTLPLDRRGHIGQILSGINVNQIVERIYLVFDSEGFLVGWLAECYAPTYYNVAQLYRKEWENVLNANGKKPDKGTRVYGYEETRATHIVTEFWSYVHDDQTLNVEQFDWVRDAK